MQNRLISLLAFFLITCESLFDHLVKSIVRWLIVFPALKFIRQIKLLYLPAITVRVFVTHAISKVFHQGGGGITDVKWYC